MKRSDKSFVSGSEMSKHFPLTFTDAYISVCMYNNKCLTVCCTMSFFFKLLRVSETSSLQTPKPLYHKVSVYAHNHSSSNLTARFHPLSLKQSN